MQRLTMSSGPRSRSEFYLHLSAYVGVGVLLVIVNLATSSDYLWFKWPLFGWGIAVILHALNVFVYNGRFMRD